MKKSLTTTIFGIILVLLIALTSCTPQTTPTPSTATPRPGTPIAPTSAPSTGSAVSAEDAAFAKIVDAAKKEGKVTAYSFNWVGDTGLAVQKAFETKYGIKLDIITGRGAEFQERIKTEKRVRQQVGDFTEGSTLLNNSMKIDGLLADVSADMPALKEKGVWFAEPTAIDPQAKTVLLWRLIVFSPYVNTKEVKPADVPKSWKDFLDPKWAGKMSFTDPNIGPGTNQYMVVLMENGIWTEAYIKDLYKQKLVFPGSV
ncbi:MAG: Ferric transporter ATP-binding subunit, partial [Dehalococcoidia bacterium]|nr:Ferric transporter ATP-binding subunit [Dehalococcoidia bacterium]